MQKEGSCDSLQGFPPQPPGLYFWAERAKPHPYAQFPTAVGKRTAGSTAAAAAFWSQL